MTDQKTVNITDAITPENPETLSKLKKALVVVAVAAAATALVAHQVKRFAERKDVAITLQSTPKN